MRILFTDLDHTLIRPKSGRKFPIHSKDWIFIPETIEALKYYINNNYKIVIITNQGGIETGFLNEKVFINKIEEVCNKLEKILQISKNSVSYRYCSSMTGYNRKPNPGMAFDFLVDEELTLEHSVMFGDMQSDMEFSCKAGIECYYDIEEIVKGNYN